MAIPIGYQNNHGYYHVSRYEGESVQGVIKNYRDLVSENYNLLLMAKNI
jgi:hypothetical protein